MCGRLVARSDDDCCCVADSQIGVLLDGMMKNLSGAHDVDKVNC